METNPFQSPLNLDSAAAGELEQGFRRRSVFAMAAYGLFVGGVIAGMSAAVGASMLAVAFRVTHPSEFVPLNDDEDDDSRLSGEGVGVLIFAGAVFGGFWGGAVGSLVGAVLGIIAGATDESARGWLILASIAASALVGGLFGIAGSHLLGSMSPSNAWICVGTLIGGGILGRVLARICWGPKVHSGMTAAIT